MKRNWDLEDEQYFGIGIYEPKRSLNIGTLWRTAYVMGAQFIFIIGTKHKHQASDVVKSWSKIPLFQYKDFDAFLNGMPYSCPLVGVELSDASIPIQDFEHPRRAMYLLGAEDNGLPPNVIEKCHHLIQLPGNESVNVSVAGSLVIYDRWRQRQYDL